MEHPIAARTLSSMFMVVLLLSPLLILPSDSREVPTHTVRVGDGTRSHVHRCRRHGESTELCELGRTDRVCTTSANS
ncbi:hypothetical protein MUK42_13634 [Musa troglodytarum]|uniref:Secreted protein n=1 Tax=Musa troglodytarum TaxID=320322 RepID=A0A9E7KSV8_9LILI|nr:hypothetical protein MUK42_13634 [Musa troglodytarum]